MYFPEPVYDAYSGLNVPTPGCHQLDGFQALEVVRARHLQYKGPGVTSKNPRDWPQDPESDLSRIRRDHEFLRVLAAAVAKRGLGQPRHRQRPAQRGGPAAAGGLELLARLHVRPGGDVPRRQHGHDAPEDAAGDRPVEPELLLPGLRLRERRAREPTQRPPGRVRLPGAPRRPRHHDRAAASLAGVGDGVGAQRDGSVGPGGARRRRLSRHWASTRSGRATPRRARRPRRRSSTTPRPATWPPPSGSCNRCRGP